MLSIYPAVFYKESNGYSVVFPDFGNLSTCGETLGEAFQMAIDCLAAHLYWLIQDGDIFPSPSPIEEIDMIAIAKELEFEFYKTDSFVNMVSVDVLEYAKTHFEKSIKKTLTIPMWLNRLALEQNINFSQVLQNALIDILELSPTTKKHTKKGV